MLRSKSRGRMLSDYPRSWGSPLLNRGEGNKVGVPPHLQPFKVTNCVERIMQAFIMTGEHLQAGRGSHALLK